MTGARARLLAERGAWTGLARRGARWLIDGTRRVLATYIEGRRPTGPDAIVLRDTCHALGHVLRAIAREAES